MLVVDENENESATTSNTQSSAPVVPTDPVVPNVPKNQVTANTTPVNPSTTPVKKAFNTYATVDEIRDVLAKFDDIADKTVNNMIYTKAMNSAAKYQDDVDKNEAIYRVLVSEIDNYERLGRPKLQQSQSTLSNLSQTAGVVGGVVNETLAPVYNGVKNVVNRKPVKPRPVQKKEQSNSGNFATRVVNAIDTASDTLGYAQQRMRSPMATNTRNSVVAMRNNTAPLTVHRGTLSVSGSGNPMQFNVGVSTQNTNVLVSRPNYNPLGGRPNYNPMGGRSAYQNTPTTTHRVSVKSTTKAINTLGRLQKNDPTTYNKITQLITSGAKVPTHGSAGIVTSKSKKSRSV
jgi:hypothetical protein